jgi:LPS export ABC transporter permease LptG
VLAFASLWVLMDLINNMKEFQEAHVPIGTMLAFYFNLTPYIYVLATPAALLLAVLYALTRMSRCNEIVSMLTAGRSLWQVLRPVFIVSAYVAIIGMALNYHWAPRGEGRRDTLLQANPEDKKMASVAQTNIMFRNDTTRRTWFVGVMPFDPRNDKINDIEVRQMDEKGQIVAAWFGRTARWFPEVKMWSFYNGVQVNYRKGAANEIVPFRKARNGTRMDITEWPETPWSIISASLLPDNLGVSELVAFLSSSDVSSQEKRAAFRTHLAHRFAYPWQCFVLVLMAAPLGVSYSRRGAIGGIAMSVFIFFGLMFLNNFFLNMGKGAHMPSWLAVWMPHLIIGTIAYLLFDMRSNNRDFPKFQPRRWLQQGLQAILNRRPATASR